MKGFAFTFFIMLNCNNVLAVNVCTQHIERIERQEGIPQNLLAAMARVESGKYNEKLGIVEPWPWAIQAEGKSYYFNSRSEAAKQVESLMKRGITNIDVGCMQINVGHHGHHFSSVEHMLDPAKNVRYAAKYLVDLKIKGVTTWSTAVGNYHSATEEHHARYKNLVYNTINKVAKDQKKMGESYIRSPGSLYTQKVSSPQQYASNSIHSYTRTYGMNRVARPVATKKLAKPITQTSRKRQALMKLNGVKDTSFMADQR